MPRPPASRAQKNVSAPSAAAAACHVLSASPCRFRICAPCAVRAELSSPQPPSVVGQQLDWRSQNTGDGTEREQQSFARIAAAWQAHAPSAAICSAFLLNKLLRTPRCDCEPCEARTCHALITITNVPIAVCTALATRLLLLVVVLRHIGVVLLDILDTPPIPLKQFACSQPAHAHAMGECSQTLRLSVGGNGLLDCIVGCIDATLLPLTSLRGPSV